MCKACNHGDYRVPYNSSCCRVYMILRLGRTHELNESTYRLANEACSRLPEGDFRQPFPMPIVDAESRPV